ncbi:hypothetical protein Z945_139 [Sulfitobacter noctilucae]|uniref:hypothetical protein n=1 Tax=Sulfitobacter noctilucae TaxID=1342302 RepID=UPI000468DEA7|nr:hypothetical protein [Sulfitobacter noctilucae]KIN75310.1 hypothetical protein Z945_139 [Sulfitobacter noctilucae]
MYRKFIATVSAAAIALTALGALPAAAADRDTTRALAAILGIAAVGALIHQNNKKDKKKVQTHRKPSPVYQKPRHVAPKRHTPKYVQPSYKTPRGHGVKPRPLPQRVNRKLLPQQCFRTFDTRKGRVAMFGNRCLQRNFAGSNRLPQQCQSMYRTPRGNQVGYDARCLRDRGYSLARG